MKCPRCLGKGYVDRDDIRRLGMSGKWGPGPCRVCGATGDVPEVQRIIERTIERQVVVTRCKFCHELTPVDLERCKSCGAPKFC